MDERPPFRVTKATLDVLKVLAEGGPDLHGYRIGKESRHSGGATAVILMRLENAGWVSSDWEPATDERLGRPRRRFYRIHPDFVEPVKHLLASRRV